MDTIINAMMTHMERTDVQECGCDLLWSLAFNSSTVKETIGRHGGAGVMVRALKKHSRSAEFLKSACGALSNMCQSKVNQDGVSSGGGLQPLVGAIHIHQTNEKLLPFVFDAIASIVVSSEQNTRIVSSLGLIQVILASLSRHKAIPEVAKSGCHTLAILSDAKGQASRIAFTGGIPIILNLLDIHPTFTDLHRVAAVVLLRMLQESSYVGREIAAHNGMRVLLYSLENGGAQQDTVAAVTHILYSISAPDSPAVRIIEQQLWLKPLSESDSHSGVKSSHGEEDNGGIDVLGLTALKGVKSVLNQFAGRKDVVRAVSRLVANIASYKHVADCLNKMNVLDKLLHCMNVHKETKDVQDSVILLLKLIYKHSEPQISSTSVLALHSLLYIYETKIYDENLVEVCIHSLNKLYELFEQEGVQEKREGDQSRMVDGKKWEIQYTSTCSKIHV